MLRLQRRSIFKSSWSSIGAFPRSFSARNVFERGRAVIFISSVATAMAYFTWHRISRDSFADQATLSPSNFIPAKLTSCETASRDTKIFTLTVPPHLLPPLDGSLFTPIWSIFVKDDEIQVERPYTPLQGIDETGRMIFWIKRYPNGEVGRWLHSKRAGDTIEIRGPSRTWQWQDGVWDEVVMISGGTGITPMYQLLHMLLIRKPPSHSKTCFTLLHSSRTPAHLPPPTILQPLKSLAATQPDRFRLQLFVDDFDGVSSPHQLQVGRVEEKAIKRFGLREDPSSWWRTFFSSKTSERQDRRRLFIVCGPEAMMNAISGPFGTGFSQGSVAGVLGRMGYSSREVWKL